MKNSLYFSPVILLLATSLIGCASLKRSQDVEVTTTVVPPEKAIVNVEPRYVGDPLSEKDIELINKLGSVPVKSHKHVKKWLDYFQGRGKRHMERYLQRSTRYLPLMKQILKEEGVPEDLVYIALIESGFNAKAYSPAAAVGYWQFIRPTGKRYNLKITRLMDERKDVVASTRAAANYFKSLYNIFGNWYLSMASYNTGENRVMRAIMRLQTRDFFEIIDRRRLPRETRNYVPKFLAAKLIGYYPRRFGFSNIDYQDEISFDTITVNHGVSLSQIGTKVGVPHERMKKLNPAYLSDYVPFYKDHPTYVRVPKGLGEQTVAILDDVKSNPPKYVAGAGFTYRVRRGDTLSHIARRHGTSIRKLRSANGLSRRSILRIGQRLRIPSRYVRVSSSGSTSSNRVAAKGDKYRVRRGDTLTHIARRHGASVSQIRSANGLGRRSLLRVGQRLVIPGWTNTDSKNKEATSYSGDVYRVRRGDTLSVIAQRFRTSVSNLRQWNSMGRRSIIKVGQTLRVSPPTASESTDAPSSAGKGVYHIVRRGENLSTIARKYRSSITDIKAMNDLDSTRIIHVGQKLKVRGETKVHIVQRGETLSQIAEKYRVSMYTLKQSNGLRRSSRIYAGSRLFIPVD